MASFFGQNHVHICKEDTSCCCSSSSIEINPNPFCPVHGLNSKPRCRYCGRFVPVLLSKKFIQYYYESE